MKTPDFALRLGSFLREYLPGQRNVSAHTIVSYSQTFVLLLEHLERHGVPASRMTLEHYTADAVLRFLGELEEIRGNTISTRNQRLGALRSFARYLKSRVPERMAQWVRITELDHKRGARKLWIPHLDPENTAQLLRQPDRSTPWGRRDAALMALLYDTGMRVQELIGLSPGRVRLESPPHVAVEGKGRKGRLIPLLPATAGLLSAYMAEWHAHTLDSRETPLFFNHQRQSLTRSGIRWILLKYIGRSAARTVAGTDRVSPHTLRHSKAMHLLRSKASLAEVQSLLGHADIRTTMGYARADAEMVREALEKAGSPVEVHGGEAPSWRRDPDLMTWLKAHCRKSI